MTRLVPLFVILLLAGCVADGLRPASVSAPPPRSRAEAGQDDVTRTAVERRLAELGRPWRSVCVEVRAGRVLLMGAVIKPDHRRKAEQTARSVPGVTEVLNELVLAEDKALDVFAPDPARADTVRRALGFSAEAGPAVRVVNGVVFLLGSAGSPQQAAQWKADAGDLDGVKWVVTYLSP